MYPRTAMERAHRAYGDGAVAQSPAALLVQVHDGMIEKLMAARVAIVEGRVEDRLDATVKVAAVIEALHLALDDVAGGEIARNLGRLYVYFIQRLRVLNLHNDPTICDELIARLGELRRAWASSVERPSTPPLETAAVSA